MKRLILAVILLGTLAACASPGMTNPWYPDDPDHTSLVVPTQ